MGAAVMNDSILLRIYLSVAKSNSASAPVHIGSGLWILADVSGKPLECAAHHPSEMSATATQTRQGARCGGGLASEYPPVAAWS
jgi:hypothetical protein